MIILFEGKSTAWEALEKEWEAAGQCVQSRSRVKSAGIPAVYSLSTSIMLPRECCPPPKLS